VTINVKHALPNYFPRLQGCKIVVTVNRQVSVDKALEPGNCL